MIIDRITRFFNTKSFRLPTTIIRVFSLAFDLLYMQNLRIPKMPVQELFYLRQRIVVVFIKKKKKQIKVRTREGKGR